MLPKAKLPAYPDLKRELQIYSEGTRGPRIRCCKSIGCANATDNPTLMLARRAKVAAVYILRAAEYRSYN
jgi:hypothetical protein